MSDTIDLHHLLADAAERLEPLPAAAIELATVVSQPHAGPDEISAVLGTDPALAAHVLREANSVFSAAQAPVGALEQAVIRIGAARVLEVAVRQQLGDRLETDLVLYEIEGAERKRLAVAASKAAGVISVATPQPVSRVVVCAALLHGIGMDVIDAVADEHIAASLRRATVSLRQMEHELVAADHAEVGGYVLRRWGLPPCLVDAVEYQHAPDRSVEAAIVCLATDLAAELLYAGPAVEHDSTTLAAITVLEIEERIDELRDTVRAMLVRDGLLPDEAVPEG